MTHHVRVGNRVLEIRGDLRGERLVLETPETRSWHVIRRRNQAVLVDDHARKTVWFSRDSRGNVWVAREGQVFRLEPAPPRKSDTGAAERPREITSPLTGRVQKIHVQEGARVEAGTPLVTVEAMKMEYHLTAPAAAEVEAILVREGDLVDLGQVLVRLSYPPADHLQPGGQ